MNRQLVLAALLLIFPAASQDRPSSSQGAQPSQQSAAQQFTLDCEFLKALLAPAEPMHIVGPIHFVGTKGLGVYLLTTPAGHILLGGGMAASSSAIASSIRKLGYKPEDIKILLSNHAHFDHVGTMADLKKLSGAAVETMDGDVALLASGGKIDYLFGKDARFYFPPVRTDRVLKDGDTVELGGVKLTARRTPGHTRGCTTFITTVQEGGRCYQVVFPDGTSVNSGTRLVYQPSYPGILQDYRQTFAVLESLHPDIFLAYHIDDSVWAAKRERAARQGAPGFVDADGYRSFVADRKARFEQLVAEEKNTVHQE
jgi:metallo-beta-lactamase class B